MERVWGIYEHDDEEVAMDYKKADMNHSNVLLLSDEVSYFNLDVLYTFKEVLKKRNFL